MYFELNGENRTVTLEDKNSTVKATRRERAKVGERGHVASPMSGVVVEVRVKEDQEVKAGDALFIMVSFVLFQCTPHTVADDH